MILHRAVSAIRKTSLSALVAGAALTAAGQPAGADPTWTHLSDPGGPSAYGETVEFSATVFGSVPGGTVTLKEGGKKLATGTLKAPRGVTGVISPAPRHTCAVTSGGAAKCWGDNEYGMLGDGTTSDSLVPIQVDGLTSGVIAVAASFYHSCALTDEGAVKCWGLNSFGQLGDGSNVDSLTPVQVSGLTSGVVAITGGYYHTCALTDKGAVKCWGSNSSGQLGNGNTNNRNVPANVSGMSSGVASIAGGRWHTCALTDDGAAFCWGDNANGQLGNDDAPTDSTTPVPVSNMTSGVKSIAGGYAHTCGVTAGGAARCWGLNALSQLGDGSTDDSAIPVQVTGLISGVVAVSTGANFSCALTTGGRVKCWGSSGGSNGQLGDGTTSSSPTPVQVTGLTSGIVSIASLYWHSCAVTGMGEARCWGDNFFGQIGDTTTTDARSPADVTGFGDHETLVPATAVLKAKSLAAGKHDLRAAYAGDADNGASSSEKLTHTVSKGGTKIKTFKLKPNKPKAGKTAKATVKVKAVAPASGKPKGKVIVKDGKTKLGTYKVAKGKAGFKWTPASTGKHKLKATFKGNGNWNKSTAKKTVTVKK